MVKILIPLAALVVLLLVGGFAYWMLVDVPAPTVKVEKVIPDERFPR